MCDYSKILFFRADTLALHKRSIGNTKKKLISAPLFKVKVKRKKLAYKSINRQTLHHRMSLIFPFIG